MTEIEQVFWEFPQTVKNVVKTAAGGAIKAICKKYVEDC